MYNIENLIEYGKIGYYRYAKIIQIIIQKNNTFINYFTHIEFSQRFTEKKEERYLTDRRRNTINKNCK